MTGLGSDDPRRHAAAHCFVADLDAPELDPSDEHHVVRVLRLRRGETVTVTDGRGRWRLARFDGTGFEATGAIHTEARAQPELAIGFSLVKGDRPELITQKLCELGVDVIIPFHSERSVVRWDEARAAQHHRRLARVAREAAMQSRRVWAPRLEPLQPLRGVLALDAVLADAAGEPLTLATPRVLIGPEGGWSDAERSAGALLVRVGPGILRAETAAIAAAALLSGLRAGIVGPTA